MDPLARIIAPFDVEIVLAALRGEATTTLFDLDGTFERSHMGDPRQVPSEPRAFNGKALLASTQTIAWLSANRPVGDPLRAAVPAFYEKVRTRLANPHLLLMGGFTDSVEYVYFCPAKPIAPEHRALLERCTVPIWKSETFPFPGVYAVYETFISASFVRLVERTASTPLAAGSWEADPRASVPDLVRAAMDRHKLSEDAATVFLQLLTLADCTNEDLAMANGFPLARLKKAGAELAERSLVVSERKLRAGRDYALPGAWEKLRAPQPGVERDKLVLFNASMVAPSPGGAGEEILSAPLGRILPLAPLHEIFATAWASEVDRTERKPRVRPVAKSGADARSEAELIAGIVASPEEDGPRLVYADLLTERGDRRGELIVLACRMAELGRKGESDAGLRFRFDQLFEDPETSGAAFVQQHAAKLEWDRGFVVGVHMKIPAFARYGARIMKEHPLLRTLVIDSGLRRLPDKQLEALAACEALGRIVDLDFADHFLGSRPFVRFIVSPHLKLQRLRIGANERGGGIGKSGLVAIAKCAALGDLRVLDIPGQRVGDGGAAAIASATIFPKLEVLRLPLNDISDAGAIALLESPNLRHLRVLDLDDLAFFARETRVAYGPRENRFSPEVRARLEADPRTRASGSG